MERQAAAVSGVSDFRHVAIRKTWTALPMTSAGRFWPWGPLGIGLMSHAGKGEQMARITAFGGVFFHSANPQTLGAWYRDTLGLSIEDWGGAMIRAEGAGPPYGVWAPFNKDTGYFKPSSREFMINFAVDDLDGFLAGLEAKGVEVNGRQQMDGMGKFAWILDPDGTKIELWQPEQEPSSN